MTLFVPPNPAMPEIYPGLFSYAKQEIGELAFYLWLAECPDTHSLISKIPLPHPQPGAFLVAADFAEVWE